MKCPKCSYISFDYNQVCPKCNKNISSEQEKFFLPSFRPDPPSLLGFLTGEANESNVNLNVPTGSHMDMSHGEDINLNDSVIMEQDNLDLGDDVFDMSLVPEESGDVSMDQESVIEADRLFSDSDFRLEVEEKPSDEMASPLEMGEEEDLSLDLGELSLEKPDELLDEFSFEETEKAQEIAIEDADQGPDLSISPPENLGAGIEIGPEETESEIELNLDDLKLDDLDNLESATALEPSINETELALSESEAGTLDEGIETEEQGLDLEGSVEEIGLEISEPTLEEPETGKREKTVVLDDFSLYSLDSGKKEDDFDLGDLNLDDSFPGNEDSPNLEPFKIEATLPGDMEKSVILDDLSMYDSGELEKSFDLGNISLDGPSLELEPEAASDKPASDSDEIDIDLDAMSLDVEEYQKGARSDDNDFVLDLEDMDIDIDLNEPKK
jgi:hypothetical protein